MYYFFLYISLDTRLTEKSSILNCPKNYREVKIEKIDTINANPKKCAEKCYKNSRCKAFTILGDLEDQFGGPYQQGDEDPLESIKPCILAGFPEERALTPNANYKGKEQSEIICVLKYSKFISIIVYHR